MGSERIAVRADPDGVRIEIAPPVSSPPLARRLVAAFSVLSTGTLIAAVRLSAEWRQVAAGRDTIPAGVLAALTIAVLAGAPAALFGLVPSSSRKERTSGARNRSRDLHLRSRRAKAFFPFRQLGSSDDPPVPLWWTWTFGGSSSPDGPAGVGATLGNVEKTALAALLVRLIE